ncbi:MAG: hypothetical protein LBU20_02155 [Candidatus Nomurabacteria bacterium]|jgi:hypothetical protein|nr:hypothetical protein [Candidatus Nomurabacteria bacterium]
MDKKSFDTRKIADAIRRGDFKLYQRVRYSIIQEGEDVIFRDEDFFGVDFGIVISGFFVFKNCNLGQARSFRGSPLTFINCDAKEIDLRGVCTDVKAENSDFRGMKFDSNTVLGSFEDSVFSEFRGCQVDGGAKHFFEKQGVRFL